MWNKHERSLNSDFEFDNEIINLEIFNEDDY